MGREESFSPPSAGEASASSRRGIIGPGGVGMIGRIVLGLILMLVAAASASAQTSNGPCPALKTKLRLTDGNTIEAVKDLGGGVCRFKSQKDGKYFERILGAFLASDPNFERARGLVPLEVGKKVEFQTSGADDKGQPTAWIKTLAVEKYEKTTSPAGTFDALV